VPAALDDPRKSPADDPLGQFTALAGKQPSIVLRWEHWGLENDGGVDPDWMRRVARSGSIPMYTWDPWNPNLDPPDQQQGFLLRDVAVGAHDAYVRSVARAIADYGGPVFVRFAQEMNGTWYPWGKHQNSPDEYVAAWRHVHAIFDQEVAGQVTWVWNPSEKNHPEPLSLWYPGDDVVDWVAIDGYNWDDPSYWRSPSGDTWRWLDQVFGPSYNDLASFVPGDKPFMIAETASTERPGDPNFKAAWICDSYGRSLPEVFSRVKAVLWFDEQKSEGGKPYFWPVESSPESREAYASALSAPYYLGSLGDLPTRLGHAKVPPPDALP
jgi:hypothetical protein